ncbi:hypothetical protein LXL04_026571 [Taraxacum kok-saghyz]
MNKTKYKIQRCDNHPTMRKMIFRMIKNPSPTFSASLPLMFYKINRKIHTALLPRVHLVSKPQMVGWCSPRGRNLHVDNPHPSSLVYPNLRELGHQFEIFKKV